MGRGESVPLDSAPGLLYILVYVAFRVLARRERARSSPQRRAGARALKARGVFVTGTDTGIGKTRASVALLRAHRAHAASRDRHEAGRERMSRNAARDCATTMPKR